VSAQRQGQAATAYKTMKAEALRKISELRKLVLAHGAGNGLVHWGHVGDLQHVSEQVGDLLQGWNEEGGK
jgi:hypothetical protein